MLLVGDIGGTKTLLALYSAETGPDTPLYEKSFPSARYESLELIIEEYLSGINESIQSACFGVAGPVIGSTAKITNLSWTVDAENIKNRFNLKRVDLLNDLEAVGYAIPELKPEHRVVINPGEPVEFGNIAVLAPGTGLGEAYLTTLDNKYDVNPSEGAHVSFGPIDQVQIDLLIYMKSVKGFDHVSIERVCSGGLGIPNLYDFFTETGRYPAADWLIEELANTDDPTPVIIQTALDPSKDSPLCDAILDTFVSILAAEAGNMALKMLPTGGIYLGGGIPPRILGHLQRPEFVEIFSNKGRFKSVLNKIPIYVITRKNSGMMGAAVYGFSQ